MTFSETNSTHGLPGMRVIREALGLQQKTVAGHVGVSPQWISNLETGASDSTDNLKRKLASVLHCHPVDLMGEPTEERVNEIKAAYLSRLAAEAQAKVTAARGVAL